MKILMPIILLIFFAGTAIVGLVAQPSAQTNASVVSPSASPSTSASKETKVEKADSNKEFRDMFDTLLNRATWFFGVIGGIVLLLGGIVVWLIKWTLGQTRNDAKMLLQQELSKRGMDDLDYLQKQIKDLNAFKDRRVDWIRPDSIPEPTKELSFLHRAGLQQLTHLSIGANQNTFVLNAPDLVILSFDGSQQSKDLVKLIVDSLKQNKKEVPMLVYAPLGLRVGDAEMQLLSETALHAIANFPATLVTQAVELVRLKQA